MDSAKAVRKGEALDWDKLEGYLRANLPELTGEMIVAQFHGGHANLTYLLKFGETELVLRRPPFGKIAPGAHDMKREYRVLSKLYKHFAPAPRAYHLCEDETIIGAKFVVIERRTGVIVRYELLDCFKQFDRAEERLTDAMIRAQMDDILVLLQKRLPTTQKVSIIHNDIKFDNCQFQPDNPDKVTSFFDWDMCTLGDPLVDFGSTLSYWPEPFFEKFDLPVMLSGNFPTKAFLIEKYANYTGLDMSEMDWYQAFAYWKGAVIAEQLYARYLKGESTDERMKKFGKTTNAFTQFALDILG